MTFSIRGRIVQAGAVAAAALLASAVAAPLQASTIDQQTVQRQGQSASSERRVCAMVELTGSRVARRICRTRAEWEALGGVPANN